MASGYSTGENYTHYRKVRDGLLYSAVLFLVLHVLIFFYPYFAKIGLSNDFSDVFFMKLVNIPLVKKPLTIKALAYFLTILSLFAHGAHKKPNLHLLTFASIFTIASIVFFGSIYFISNTEANFIAYLLVNVIAFLLIMASFPRMLKNTKPLELDVFNESNQTFPQNTKLIRTPDSINIPFHFHYKKDQEGWINLVNPYRNVLVGGLPGSGKSFFIFRKIIKQLVSSDFSMLVYDYKFPELTKQTHFYLQEAKSKVDYHIINFKDPQYSHRCNPISPEYIPEFADALESSKFFMYGLNKGWSSNKNNFFSESAINLFSAVIWFLRSYKEGRYCTIPHCVQLLMLDYEPLFKILSQYPESRNIINPFLNAVKNKAYEQIEGQMSTLKNSLTRISDKKAYYILSGNDFNLAINDGGRPNHLFLANDQAKSDTYSAYISLFLNRTCKLINVPGKGKTALILDEFPTIYFNNFAQFVATARSNSIATIIGIQDFSQLVTTYGRDAADTIFNLCASVLCSQSTGQMAKYISERIGKIQQHKGSVSVSADNSTSESDSMSMDLAVPVSKISSLTSGEFVGVVADTPQQPIELKKFHGFIKWDKNKIKSEDNKIAQVPLPKIRTLDANVLDANYHQIINDIEDIRLNICGPDAREQVSKRKQELTNIEF